MRYELTINLDNAAFQDDPDELSRILTQAAQHVEGVGHVLDRNDLVWLLDSNGNTVGKWKVEADEL